MWRITDFRYKSVIRHTHPTAPHSPWQNGHVERLIGSIWRESLDHLVVFDKAQLRRVWKNYVSYYNQVRTHLSLDKDAPEFRRPLKVGRLVAIPIFGGLHHQYTSGLSFWIGTPVPQGSPIWIRQIGLHRRRFCANCGAPLAQSVRDAAPKRAR